VFQLRLYAEARLKVVHDKLHGARLRRRRRLMLHRIMTMPDIAQMANKAGMAHNELVRVINSLAAMLVVEEERERRVAVDKRNQNIAAGRVHDDLDRSDDEDNKYDEQVKFELADETNNYSDKQEHIERPIFYVERLASVTIDLVEQ
jgi:hypothetical protein